MERSLEAPRQAPVALRLDEIAKTAVVVDLAMEDEPQNSEILAICAIGILEMLETLETLEMLEMAEITEMEDQEVEVVTTEILDEIPAAITVTSSMLASIAQTRGMTTAARPWEETIATIIETTEMVDQTGKAAVEEEEEEKAHAVAAALQRLCPLRLPMALPRLLLAQPRPRLLRLPPHQIPAAPTTTRRDLRPQQICLRPKRSKRPARPLPLRGASHLLRHPLPRPLTTRVGRVKVLHPTQPRPQRTT